MPNFKPSRIRGAVTVDSTTPVTIEGISLTNFNVNAGVTAVADTTKTTILTQAFVAGTFENLAIISVSGDDYAKYFFTLNGTDIDIRRSGPDRNLQFDFTGAPYELVSGDVVDVKVEHFSIGEFLDFDATIYGYA
jgi:hypothetical protein